MIDGVLTGRVSGPVVDRAAKAQKLREFAAAEGLPLSRTVAIGDGANDLDMLAAAGYLRRFAATPSLRAIIDSEILPGPSVQTAQNLMDDVARRASTVFHPVSTCRMGPDPQQAVVDPQLRVHGVCGLSVIDASVFPTLIGGNTNAPSILVGWIGAERILKNAR